MPTVVGTSPNPRASAYSNQRKVDRCQNGVMWSLWNPGGAGTSAAHIAYSTDNGVTWTQVSDIVNASGSTSDNHPRNSSFFIDIDDYAHFVFKDNQSGYIYYRRGTPNAARTAWTWSTAIVVAIPTVTDQDSPDVVAHKEGTGWSAHIITSRSTSGVDYIIYDRLTIGSDGAISRVGGSTIAGPYSNGLSKWPSIDFNHTGDGKTVAGGTPHLYTAWSAGAIGAGKGIRFKKATYSAGSWTWGTEREIDPNRYVDGLFRWLNCLFDGTRVVIGGWVRGSSTDMNLVLHERDAADTATILREVLTNPPTSLYLNVGSITYDGGSNLYIFGRNNTVAPTELVYRKWTRSDAVLGGEVVIDGDVPNSDTFVSAKRGYSNDRIEFIYTDGTASPYNVTYDGIVLNTPPNKPPIVAPKNNNVVDRNKTIILDWEFSDPDTGDSQSKFELVYRVAGTTTWSRVVASTTNTYHALSPGTLSANDYEWQVRTYDQAGEVSPWADMAYFTAANPPTGHSITDPVVNQTIATEQYTVQWSASGQRKYELRRVADNGAGAPDTNNVLYTTGIVTSGTTRSRTLEFPTNNQTEHIQLRYSDDTGLWSTWDSVSITISYTTPPSPSVTVVGNDLNGYIAVAIDNPTPAAGEPSIVSNNLFRREEGSRVVKIAEGLIVDGTFNDYRVENRKNYEYQAQAIGDNGTTALSAWAG